MSNVPMTLSDLVIATQYHPFAHTSSYVELDDGRVFHSSHGVCTISEDRGLTWSDVKELRDVKGQQLYATSVIKLTEPDSIGCVGILISTERDFASSVGKRYVGFWRSDDNGQTWSEPVAISPPDSGIDTNALQDTAIRTSSGRIVVPMYTHCGQNRKKGDHLGRPAPMDGKLFGNQWVSTSAHHFDTTFGFCLVCYSDDDGRTWKRAEGELMSLRDYNATFTPLWEPSVTEVVPGRLLIFMRSQLGRLFQSWSEDNGQTWSRPLPTMLASSHSPAQIRTLPTGHLLCVWNQENEEEIRQGFVRTRISSAVSRDGGRVWEFFQNVESIHESTYVEPGPIHPVRPESIYMPAGQGALQRDGRYTMPLKKQHSYSYPSVFVMKDRVFIAYPYHESEEHPTKAQLVQKHFEGSAPSAQQKFKVLPLNWFYGGKEPAENPYLQEAYAPAKP